MTVEIYEYLLSCLDDDEHYVHQFITFSALGRGLFSAEDLKNKKKEICDKALKIRQSDEINSHIVTIPYTVAVMMDEDEHFVDDYSECFLNEHATYELLIGSSLFGMQIESLKDIYKLHTEIWNRTKLLADRKYFIASFHPVTDDNCIYYSAQKNCL
ncbi:MAG: hypothetical protein ACOX4O_07505 [Eubacteriales bacterium]